MAALFLNGADYYLGGMIAFISSPIMYIIWKRMYGGLYVNDPEKYPINPRTKLAVGDFHRITIVFGIIAVIGLIGSLWWFDWYEVCLLYTSSRKSSHSYKNNCKTQHEAKSIF